MPQSTQFTVEHTASNSIISVYMYNEYNRPMWLRGQEAVLAANILLPTYTKATPKIIKNT